jgi:exonuclease SbcC
MEKSNPIRITEVIIDNFQSHEHTAVKFKDGLNSIIGESNQGKTAILRAIMWCLYNEPRGSDFIRTGKSRCTVEVKFSDGTSILRRRDRTSSGHYEITNPNGISKEYKGFGNDVPIDVSIAHQMPVVYLAKDYKENLSIGSQLDPAFLIGTSGANRAAAIGRLIGVQIIDQAISDASKNTKGYNRKIKDLEEDYKKNEEDLKAFDSLDNDKAVINMVQGMVEIQETLTDEINLLHEFQKELLAYQNLIPSIEQDIKKMDADKYIPDIDRALEDIKLMKILYEFDKQIVNIRESVLDTETIILKLPDYNKYKSEFDNAESIIKELKESYSFRNNLLSIQLNIEGVENSIVDIDIKAINKDLTVAQDLCDDIKKMLLFDNEMDSIMIRSKDAGLDDYTLEEDFEEQKEEVYEAEIALRDYLKEVGVCPMCKNKLDHNCISNMIGGE